MLARWIAALVLALAAPAAFADDPCGTGGMGGTGAPIAAHSGDGNGPAPDPVGGMGGTGIVAALAPGESGRVVGTITRFGSICVNGLRVSYDADTPTELDGRTFNAADLHIGQLVRIEVMAAQDGLRAERIALLSSVVGIVTARDEEGREFRVLGQPVQLGVDTWIAMTGTAVPALGTPVRVSGLMTPSGSVSASRVEGAAASDPAVVMARITELDGRYAAVGAVRVEFPPNGVPAGTAIGDEIAVRGRWNGEALVAESAVLAPRGVPAARPASIEGYLHACSGSNALGLDGQVLEFEGISAPRILIGRRVVAEGRQRSDGVLIVSRMLPSPFTGDSLPAAEPFQCTARPTPGG